MKTGAVLSLLLLLTGCAHSTIVPFESSGGDKAKKYAPTEPAHVSIYRSTRPFENFVELGLISYRMTSFNLISLYDQIRKDAAGFGADAVIDIKVSSETHTGYMPQNQCTPITTCGANGSCYTHDECHTEQVLTTESSYLITGSMIRKKP